MTTRIDNFDYLFKIVLIGESNVGKTNILARLTQGKFLGNSNPTIGVEFGTKMFKFNDSSIKAQIWDTAGQERYHAIISAYYRGACGAVIVYDVAKKDSLQKATNIWLKNLKEACVENIPIMLLGNKADKTSERELTTEEGRDAAIANNLAFYETSAKSGLNINEAFEKFLREVYDRKKTKDIPSQKKEIRREDLKGKKLDLHSKQKTQGSWCC